VGDDGAMRTSLSPQLRAATLLAVAGWALTSCSSGTTHSSSSVVAPSPAASTGAPTTATAPATTGPTTTAGSSRCHTAQLAASAGPTNGAAGHIAQVFILRNTAGATCTLFGYPGLLRLDAARAPMETTVTRGSSVVVRDPGPALVTLAPGASASFASGWGHIPTASDPPGTCPASTSLEITPPDETDHLTIPAAVDACDHGTIAVSAVVAGTAGPS